MKTKCQTLKKIFLLLIFLGGQALSAETFTEIVAFGDSLTDSGNRAIATNGNSTVYPKEVWVTQLAGMMKIQDFKPSGRDAYTGGTNYAFGGATTGYIAKLGNWGGAGKYNLTNQISERYLNPSFNTGGVRKDALHILRIGGNDLMFACGSRDQIMSQWSGMNDIAVNVVKDTEGQIGALARAGVRHVMWLSLSDPAQFPSVRKNSEKAGPMAGAALAAATNAAKAFNAEMDAAIVRLEQAHPGLKIIKMDGESIFGAILADPQKYGFTNMTEGLDDDGHFFARDGLHPTSHAHRVLAEFALEVLRGPGQVAAQPVSSQTP